MPEPLENLLDFCEAHSWMKAENREVLLLFLRDLISSENQILRLFNKQKELKACGVVLDLIKNPARAACLEVLAMTKDLDPVKVYREMLIFAEKACPRQLFGYQVAFPEDLNPYRDLISEFKLHPYYDLFDMKVNLKRQESYALHDEVLELRDSDYSALYRLTADAFAENPDTNIPDYETWLRRRYRTTELRSFGIKREGELIAFLNLFAPRGVENAEVRILGVLKPFRGQGLGNILLSHALAISKEQGCNTASLSVAVHNEKALKLYQSLGFEKVESSHIYLWRKS